MQELALTDAILWSGQSHLINPHPMSARSKAVLGLDRGSTATESLSMRSATRDIISKGDAFAAGRDIFMAEHFLQDAGKL